MSQEKDNISEVYARIERDLEKTVDYIEEELKNNLENFLEDVLDIQLIVNYPQKETIGFNIAIGIGNPNIYLVYERGICQIRGYWGSKEDIKQ